MTKLLRKDGIFYKTLLRNNDYDQKMQECISDTVLNLSQKTTTVDRPGMLLGKIQSGKTRTFLGVIGLAFDNDYDVTIILTKGTKALAQQTMERLNVEFSELRELDKIQIFDIMWFPKNLTGFELDQKMVVVVKKEMKNMIRLHDAFFQNYPQLKDKNILVIDDEADFASIGFSKTRHEGLEIKKIAGSIDEFRKNVALCSYLQVTATPYSLYLQPEDLTMESRNLEFKPIKPAFTSLVPVHDKYIGGEYYFGESQNEESLAYSLYEPVDIDEISILKKQDRRSFKLEDTLTSKKVKSIRNAIVNFIVGGCIRRLQDRIQGMNEKKYSFIIHTEQKKSSHGWQESIIFEIKEQLADASNSDNKIFNDLLDLSYNNLKESMILQETEIPSFEATKEEVRFSLRKDHIMVTVVNSEKDVKELLDDSGQLKLRTPLNIFIGGQILDRGITIGNLIGFYYGRSPKTFQQDTVLQHSRMYGARPIEDLTVTRFYTTPSIYKVMNNIHEFDTALREAFITGSQEDGVVFIRKDTEHRIIPCSPNKILLSKTTTLKPSSRLLPKGFTLKSKTHLKKPVSTIDDIIRISAQSKPSQPFLMEIEKVITIVNCINETFKNDDDWDLKAFLSSLEYLCNQTKNDNLRGMVWIVVRENREIQRLKPKDGRIEDAPDTKIEIKMARELAKDIPALILLRQNGDEEKGWTGHPFWWPVLVTPSDTKTVVFTSEQLEVEE